MINWLIVVRWIHILGGAAWLGEVITVNFVIMPIVAGSVMQDRKRYMTAVFPLVFRLASVLSLVTVGAGLTLHYLVTGWSDLDLYFSTARGLAILAGALLGLLLTLFHFTMERRLEPQLEALDDDSSEEEVQSILRYLRVIPRIGLGVMVLIFLLMMSGARGF